MDDNRRTYQKIMKKVDQHGLLVWWNEIHNGNIKIQWEDAAGKVDKSEQERKLCFCRRWVTKCQNFNSYKKKI